ncbi:MAG: diguanylate cyclase [Pyrinomonadaceae bacterium]
MEKSSAPRRDHDHKPTAKPPKCPDGWTDVQASLAAANGLSILLVAGHQPPALAVSNNNSICQAFQSSPDYVRLCDPFCGKAYERALDAGGPTHYRCHAGLHCVAAPVELGAGRKLAVIAGRSFITSADYRALAERFRAGDLQDLLSEELFHNVIFAARRDLDRLASEITSAAAEFELTGGRAEAAKHSRGPKASSSVSAATETPASSQANETSSTATPSSTITGDASSFNEDEKPAKTTSHPFTLDPAFVEACAATLDVFAEKHGFNSIALLLHKKAQFVPTYLTGKFKAQTVHIEIGPKDARLALTAKAGASLALRENGEGYKIIGTLSSGKNAEQARDAELFPLVVGDEIKAVFLIGEPVVSEEKRNVVSKFCRDIALPIEVLRLRGELDQRTRFTNSLRSFVETVNAVDPAEVYRTLLRQSAALLHAERGSLLLFDEASNELSVKAAIGPRAEIAKDARIRLGESISGAVMREGRPLVVHDLESAGQSPAPADRLYKTKSFISYPIMIGGRKVGVLNVTDKSGGGAYDEIDLNLLETFAPQLALALDRAEWQEKATQFQLMSITDPLTGLLNRRYLEERLSEELSRSKRHQYPMSFMMIDIDNFKMYNDLNGHQAGDQALDLTAQALKSALRSADVAARYGGEEFCILLPQTSLDEANVIAERIRNKVAETLYPHGKTQKLGTVTVSIGLSAYTSALESPAAIIGAADRALYEAKSVGKNCVRAFLDTPEASDPTRDDKEEAR